MSTTEKQSGNEKDRVPYVQLKLDGYHTKLETQEELLEKYIYLLNPLVEKLVGEDGELQYDVVQFLDKSARPLYWLLKEMWPHMAPQTRDEQTGEIVTAPMPKVRFANIDRLDWRKDKQLEIEEGGARPITDSDIEGLRAIFNVTKDENLDGKRVLIVDEQSETGDTLRVARKLFEKAFPDSHFDGFSWIIHPYNTAGGRRNSIVKEIPMWYPPKDEKGHHKDTGRGVLSPVPYEAEDPAHGKRFPPSSYQFLSTVPRILKENFTEEEQLELALLRNKLEIETDPAQKEKITRQIESLRTVRDPESLQLRREMGQIAVDFAKGRLFPAITTSREEILGMKPREYNLKAREVRERRKRLA